MSEPRVQVLARRVRMLTIAAIGFPVAMLASGRAGWHRYLAWDMAACDPVQVQGLQPGRHLPDYFGCHGAGSTYAKASIWTDHLSVALLALFVTCTIGSLVAIWTLAGARYDHRRAIAAAEQPLQSQA